MNCTQNVRYCPINSLKTTRSVFNSFHEENLKQRFRVCGCVCSCEIHALLDWKCGEGSQVADY